MGLTDAEYLAILKDALSTDFLKSLLYAVVTAHRSAPSHVSRNFDKPERLNLLGHIRRAKLNEEVIAVGERFKVRTDWRAYGRGSGYYVLVSSKRIFLVICAVRSKRTMVRDAEYRRALAMYNEMAQTKLSFMPDIPTPQDSQHLCILIHGRRKGKNSPAFADIAFPDKTFTEWICRLDLFREFPALVDRLILKPEMEAQPGRQRARGVKKDRSA
jgi:hypothetical protein